MPIHRKFPLEIIAEHLIIRDGDHIFLIDTGAPITIHQATTVNFCSKEWDCSTESMGLTTKEVSSLLGSPITTLLGADILSHYRILIDVANKVVEFSTGDIAFDGTEIPLTMWMGIPKIHLSVGGNTYNIFLDTGAKLSYLFQEIVDNEESIGTKEDFYPGLGKFQTKCYSMPTRLGNSTFTMTYGVLPSLLEMMLQLVDVQGIIGFEFFQKFTVLLDIEGGKLTYKS